MSFSSVVNLRTASYSFLFTSWVSNSLWFILDADVSSLSVVQEVFHFAGVFREPCFCLTEFFSLQFLIYFSLRF